MVDLKEVKEKIEEKFEEVKEDFNALNIIDFTYNGVTHLTRILGNAAIYLQGFEELNGKEKRDQIISCAMNVINIKWIPDFIERKLYYMAINFAVEKFKRKGWNLSNL